MNLEDIKNDLIGVWTGDNILRLSWMPSSEFRSAGKLTAASAVRDKFLSVKYQWSHEDTPHEGLIFIGYDEKQQIATAVWIDSWHQNTAPMLLRGTISDSKSINLRGTYEVPNHPDWGWRIVIIPSENDLRLIMSNITPEEVEDIAVQAIYKRVVEQILR